MARVVLLTGASGVIGSAIARQIADRGGFELVLVGRRPEALSFLAHELARRAPETPVRFEATDLSTRGGIEALRERFVGGLDVLINNAACTPKKRELTADGIEAQLATNVLGYMWMMDAFAPVLAQSEDARIVNVASYYAGDLDVTDLEFVRRRYDNNAAYRQSKQANRMLTVKYAELLRARGITVNSCHPGDVSSPLANNLGFGGSMTADASARTPVWLATSDEARRHTGRFFAGSRPTPCEFERDRDAIERLYEACRNYA